MSIDFSKAPEGATHYCESNGKFYRDGGHHVEVWSHVRRRWFPSQSFNSLATLKAIPTFEPFVSVEDVPPTGRQTYTPEQLERAVGVSTKFDHLPGPEKALAIASFVIGGEIDKANEAIAGNKRDSGKPLMGAVPPNALLAVAQVLTFGAEKYGRDNWRQVDSAYTHYMDVALRHINAYQRGEAVDPESGESHLAHAVCSLMFMLELQS